MYNMFGHLLTLGKPKEHSLDQCIKKKKSASIKHSLELVL